MKSLKLALLRVMVKLVSSALNFHLEKYEGPLDLLLDLIRKQQINIYDIPIASITQQYLEYMQNAMELDIELSSEFVYMAATLIHIKSRHAAPDGSGARQDFAAEEDPRTELVDRLIEHERFKNAAEMLQQKRVVEEAIVVESADRTVSGRRPKARSWRSRSSISSRRCRRCWNGQEPARSTRSAGSRSVSRT